MSQSKPPTPMPKPVNPSVAQPGQAAPGARPGSVPSQQGQRIAAHGQTIYVQQQRGVDPRWIAIASVTATLIALLFVAVVLWQYRNQPAQQQAQPAVIVHVNSTPQGTTAVSTPAPTSPVAASPSVPSAAPAAAAPVAAPAASPIAAPVAAAPTASPAKPAAVQSAPVAATPAPAVKRDPPTGPSATAAASGASTGSAPRSAIPAAGEDVTKPVAPTRLGPVETPVTPTAAAAPEAPAADQTPRSGANKTAGVVVPWNEANQYMGKLITVEGTVVSARNTGSVCFLNFDKNWQGKFYIAIVEPSAMTAWGKPPQEHFLNQKIRVTGQVSLYQDRPQMRITKAEQITIAPE